MVDGESFGGAAASRTGRAGPATGPVRGRVTLADLLAFRRALDASTRRAVVTPLIVLGCWAIFAAMAADGVPILWPEAAHLVGWGANDGARVILRQEYGRLAASVFVHGGLFHLVVNMSSLLAIGPMVERIYGPMAFTILYLAAGIGGAIASAAVPPVRVSVGASGAICGLLGGLLAFLVRHRRAMPPTVLHRLRRDVLGVLLLMVVLGAWVPGIDQAAHLGGLAAGFISGVLLIGPWPVAPGSQHRLAVRRTITAGAIAAALAVAAVALSRRGDTAVPPALRLDDLAEQLAPILRESSAIRGDLFRSLGELGGGEGLTSRGSRRAAVRDLRARAAANAARLRRVRSPHPELRAIPETLARALASQVDQLDALERYLETGRRADLDAAHDALAATIAATRDCEELRDRFMNRHGLTPGRPSGGAD